MITSQNVPSEAQIRAFLFRRNIMFRSQDIQVIYQICDVMMSIST